MEDKKYYITFSSTYKFEDTDYSGLDLSGLESLTTADLINARAAYNRQKYLSEDYENDIRYSMIIAQIAAKDLPMEWFLQLPARMGNQVHRAVRSFFGV